ncbi:cell wall synthesis protein CwsA [Mycobacterium antarcticum]|uniref:cell wall synthesis protein CwsA n=1 Tax=Mycolicibacterium sp. TUM20984 TaxID=3023368 RepID=UPI0023A34BA8|nr:cell wall synthesis protein CwsA [Mycolicibacterium sp. TUM20984]GLP78590.1 cell wall synthesis protein CwsA [Mycolicibacterium sp. TUM20984]
MSAGTPTARLTPAERIARGLKYTAVGPVDLTRGALGVGFDSTRSSVSWAANRYRRGRIKSQLTKDLAAAQEAVANELAAAQEVVANLPQALQQARKSRRRPRPLLLIGAGVAVLAVGAVSFSIIRRSTQPEPSPLPPSVDAVPKP